MISIVRTKKEVLKLIGPYLLDKEVFKELGEPILFEDGDAFIVKTGSLGISTGFCCVNVGKVSKLKYFYVDPEQRGSGVFSEIYKEMETLCIAHDCETIKAVSTSMALPMYQKKGFEAIKSWTNYHKIQKNLK